MAEQMPGAGKYFEKIVAELNAIYATGQDTQVVANDFVIGTRSGVRRQIDVAIRSKVLGSPLFIIVECKDHKRTVTVEEMDALAGKLLDLQADKAVMVSNSGFTQSAITYAKNFKQIQLAGVFDEDDEAIRLKIRTEVVVDIHDTVDRLECSFHCVVDGIERPSPEQLRAALAAAGIDFPALMGGLYERIDSDFLKRYAPGYHEYEERLIEAGSVRITGTCKFTKRVRRFVNPRAGRKVGRGIIDLITWVPLLGPTDFSIDFDPKHIVEEWQEVLKFPSDAPAPYELVIIKNGWTESLLREAWPKASL